MVKELLIKQSDTPIGSEQLCFELTASQVSLRLLQNQYTSQFKYYSEDSNFDYASMMSVVTSVASASMERQTLETFNRCINHKVVLPKQNDESSTNDQWIWLADV